MSKAVMISIRPRWCELIANGEKTIEVRKTRPKLETPFKCYIYCTEPRFEHEDFFALVGKQGFYGGRKVIGEFVCDRIDRLARIGYTGIGGEPVYKLADYDNLGHPIEPLLKDACLRENELETYLQGRVGLGWHISDLKIYDKPRELSEFTGLRDTRFGAEPVDIKRLPQSWRYVEELRT